MESQLVELDKQQLFKFRRLLVIGDLHGDYDSFRSLLKVADPAKDCMIFLGDYADRGAFGIEIIDALSRLTESKPTNIILLRGNHEDYSEEGEPHFYPSNLPEEVEKKNGVWSDYFRKTLKDFLQDLHLAAIVPENLLFVHGGISSKIKSTDDLKHPTEEVKTDVLWSDPFEGLGENPNANRGVGVEFGSDVTSMVCKNLGIKKIVRSHEPQKALKGPYYMHHRKVITVSSTRVYGGCPFVLVCNPSDLMKFYTIRLS
jgi:predicted phosphodiesterase